MENTICITLRRPLRVYVYEFVRSVIRHRNVLISRQISTTNKMKTLRLIEQLTRANSLTYSDPGSARFFLNNQSDILYLINQGDTEKLTRFRELMEEAQIFSKL